MDESTARSRHPDSIGEAFLSALFLILALFVIAPSLGNAQVPVATDITSSGLGTVVPLEPPSNGVYDITGGTRPGGGPNLFHSFGDFSVGSGHIANFLNTPVNGSLPLTSNILGRVTGGNISNIYGTIQTTDFGNANLFLVNPSGIILGPTGSVNVGGSVSFSTAQYLRLFDGVNSANFYADSASDGLANSVLAVAPVVDFGFLSPAAYGFLTAPDPNATITVQGSALRVPIIFDSETGQPKGSTLSLVGESINIIADPDTGTPAALTAPSGQINLVSVMSPGEFLFQGLTTGPNDNGASFTTMGTVTIKEGATLDVSGQFDVDGNLIGNGNSGTVFVRGGQLVMDASTIQAITWGAVDGASTAVDIQVSQKVELTNSSAILTLTFGPGRGGDVQLIADTLTMKENAPLILTATGGGGVGGDVVLNVRTVSLMGSASIQSSNQNFDPGLGQGGNVIIQGLPGAEFGAAQSVSLFDGSSLVSQTLGSDGGRVAITSESLTMDGPTTTINASANDVGRGGDIVVRVQQATLSGGATIITQNFTADPNAQAVGTVTVQGLQEAGSMADSVDLSGSGSGIVSDSFGQARSGDVALHAKTVSLTDGAVIQAGTLATTAAGGNVGIVADSVDISGGSHVSSQASRSDAGQVTITANTLILDNGLIATSTSSEGRAGDVVLNVGSVSLANGATINSSSSGTDADAGNAGNVTITSSGSFTSDASTIATSAENAKGGDILIDAQNVQLSNATVISASSRSPLLPDGAGNAGNITITSDSNVVMQNSSVTTEAGDASGGSIEIDASDAGMIQLVNSRVSTSVGGRVGEPGASDGGNINIDPQFVVLQNSQILAQAFAGAGGAINIIATSAFIADPVSIISASSTLGISGTVNIQSPLQNVGGELTALTQEFSSAAALLAQQCAARAADGKFSTFVVAAREGLPAEPGGFLASPSWVTGTVSGTISAAEKVPDTLSPPGLFPKYDAKPIQLARLGNACHR